MIPAASILSYSHIFSWEYEVKNTNIFYMRDEIISSHPISKQISWDDLTPQGAHCGSGHGREHGGFTGANARAIGHIWVTSCFPQSPPRVLRQPPSLLLHSHYPSAYSIKASKASQFPVHTAWHSDSCLHPQAPSSLSSLSSDSLSSLFHLFKEPCPPGQPVSVPIQTLLHLASSNWLCHTQKCKD